MNRVELINRMEDEIVTMLKIAHSIDVEIATLEIVGEDVWTRSSQIARSIISTRKQVAQLKLDEGGYRYHTDVPPRIGGEMD